MSDLSEIPPKAAPSSAQIRSRRRVRDLAEVYTDEREVKAMLDLVPDMFPSENAPGNVDHTFLEPACGHGNFVVAILTRKLRYVTARLYGRGGRLEHRVLRCVASIYGIDISADNVIETRERMRSVVGEHLSAQGVPVTTPAFSDAVGVILATNVVCADTLADAPDIELVAYEPRPAGTFVREWSHPLDPAAGLDLFTPGARRDAVAVHYSELARQPEPKAAVAPEREAA